MPLLYGRPFAQPESLPLPPADRESLVATISTLFHFIARLPHIQGKALHVPVTDGWTLNEPALRRYGRTEDVIALLMRLPYFQSLAREPENPYEDRSVRLTDDSLSIAYGSGEVWEERLHRRCPTPGHVLWLAKPDGWEGTALLLDAKAGTITEYSAQAHGPPIASAAERAALPPEDRWMSYPTWSAEAYCEQAIMHYTKLIWVPRPPRRLDILKWIVVARNGDDVWEGLEATDPDFDKDESAEEDGDARSEAGLGEASVNLAEEDFIIQRNEVASLMNDAGVTNALSTTARARRPRHQAQLSPAPGDECVPEWQKKAREEWKELIAIFHANQWPTQAFNKAGCVHDLLQWREDQNA